MSWHTLRNQISSFGEQKGLCNSVGVTQFSRLQGARAYASACSVCTVRRKDVISLKMSLEGGKNRLKRSAGREIM